MKILLWDVELSLATYYAYPAKKPQYLNATQIKHRQFMISAAWKWHGEKETHAVSVLDNLQRFGKSHRDDYCVVKKIGEVIEQADVLCGHNADNFDLKHLNYIRSLHGMNPLPNKKTIDTLKEARKHFKAPSNSMDNLLKAWGHVGKQEKPDFQDWIKAAEGDVATILKVVRYNKYDIEGQEFLYDKIRPFMHSHPNSNIYNETQEQCPKCGSSEMSKRGFTYTKTSKRQQYQCKSCGGWSTAGKNLLKKDKKVDVR